MSAPPGGTVTFLFTDIEGSTRLLHRLGDAYAGVLAEHQRLLREAFAAFAGHGIDTQGDAFFVGFARATDAVAAAARCAVGAGRGIPGRMASPCASASACTPGNRRVAGRALRRPRRPPGGASRGRRAWRPGPPLRRDAGGPPGSRPGRADPARPGRASPQGLRPAGAPLPAHHPRPPHRLPAGERARRSAGSRRGPARRSPLRWWRSPRRSPGSCCSRSADPDGRLRTLSSMRTRWG